MFTSPPLPNALTTGEKKADADNKSPHRDAQQRAAKSALDAIVIYATADDVIDAINVEWHVMQ